MAEVCQGHWVHVLGVEVALRCNVSRTLKIVQTPHDSWPSWVSIEALTMQTYSHLWKGRIPWPSLACSYSSGHHNHDDTISIINQSHSRLIFRTTTWFQARTKGVIWKHGNEDCEKETTNLYELQINHCAPIISNDKHSVPPLCMLHHDLKNVLLIELWFIYLAAFLQFMNAHTHTYIINIYINMTD